jgi:hypothetical protein
MTNREALISILKPYQSDDHRIEKVCIDYNIESDLEYTEAESGVIARACIDVLQELLAMSSISEGDMSISYDQKGMKLRLLNLARKHGFKDVINLYSSSIHGTNIW